MIYQKTLPGGIRVIGERIAHFQSVTLAFWLRAGVTTEGKGEAGMSHFLEHMLFKGTPSRTASDISSQIDGVGGQINAYTAKEYTCYHVKVTSEHLPLAFDVLSDMVKSATLPLEELEKERGVIIEEINMSNDAPDDVAHEMINDTYFKGHPLSKPILGTKTSINAMQGSAMHDYIQRLYGGENMVVSLAGNFDFAQLDALCEKWLSHWPVQAKPEKLKVFEPNAQGVLKVKRKPVEQVHICLGLPGIEYGSDEAPALITLNNILGGGMSSRLFQEIREKRGLVYSVFSYPVLYQNCGMFTLYAGTSVKQSAEVCKLLLEELHRAATGEFSEEEFVRAKEQMKGGFALGQESTGARASSLGKSTLLLGRVRTPEQTMAHMNKVQLEDVSGLAKKLLNQSPKCVLVGRIDKQSDAAKALGY